MSEQRRLAAILVADVVGYSKLVGSDEAGTLARLKALRADVIDPAIAKHSGRLFKSMGDGFLVEFASAVQAVACAKAIQDANAGGGLPLRIGIHLGDVVVQGDDLLGDGVNIAARVEGVAEPGGIAISREVHAQVRGKVDFSFADRGEVALKNIEHPVHVFVVSGSTDAAPVLALPDKPSIAVLPFQNMSGDPEQEYFADGMVEDIITALSLTRQLFVIARNSSFTYKGRAVDIKQVGRELGVRYVLEGSVRKAGGKVRITGQLIDASSGAHIWADRFEGPLEDAFDLQDQIASRVVAAIQPALTSTEIARTAGKPVRDWQAYDYHLQGMHLFYRDDADGNERALDLFRRAIAADDRFAPAHSIAAICILRRKDWGWADVSAADRQEAEALCRRALEIDPDNPRILSNAANVCTSLGKIEEMAHLAERALQLDPNLVTAWLDKGWAALLLGKSDALDCFERAYRLNPLEPRAYRIHSAIANAHYLAGRYEAAIASGTEAMRLQPRHIGAIGVTMAAQAMLGRLEEARRNCALYMQLNPAARVSEFRKWYPLRRDEDFDKVAQGLLLAGMPSGVTPSASPLAPALALPDKPSIAVLPFQNMSGDPEQEYFVDGLVEDITTTLSRFKELFVIARNSAFAYKGRSVDIKQVGRELGVRYVLEGSVRKAGNRLRITGQLIDTQSGAHLWADRFDGALEDIFDLQDRVATSVAGAAAPQINQAEMDKAKRKPVESLDAYDLVFRGMAKRGERTREGEEEALRLFYAAIERAPEFATPYGLAAGGYLLRRADGRVQDKAWEEAETRRLAARVAQIGGDDPIALSVAGAALFQVCQDYEAGMALIDRALAINPNDVIALRFRAWTDIFLGQPERALDSFARALRLSPLDPRLGDMQRGMAAALTFLGRFEEAVSWAEKALANEPDGAATLRVATVACALAGKLDEARRIATRLCQQIPALRVSNIRNYISHRRQQDIELFAEGLRRAGVPE